MRSKLPSAPGLKGFGATVVIRGLSFETVNVIVGETGPSHVVPVASHDFTDAVWSPYVSELGVVKLYGAEPSNDTFVPSTKNASPPPGVEASIVTVVPTVA